MRQGPAPTVVEETRRDRKKSSKSSEESPPEKIPNPLQPRIQWMMENDPRTEEEADADWRRVTDSIFGTNTRAEPKVDEGEDFGMKPFRPNWGNDPTLVTQELKDEEQRWSDLWTNRRKVADRKEIDHQREGGGSPVTG
jgi:hypothetical protein